MLQMLFTGGILVAAAAAVWLLVSTVAGGGSAPAWVGPLILYAMGAALVSRLLQWVTRRLQKVFNRRCIQCGRPAVKGSIYCGPHLRETTISQRERAEIDRL
jgi:hypothetical protein